MCMFMYVLNVYMCTPVSRAKFNPPVLFLKVLSTFLLEARSLAGLELAQ